MASYNRVILLGNLTRDPELRYIASGMAVTELGLAVNDRRKNANGEWIEETTFVDVTLWARTAEVASEYLTKGSPVLIEGRLKLDTWEATTARSARSSAWSASGCNCSAAAAARGGGRSGGGRARAAAAPAGGGHTQSRPAPPRTTMATCLPSGAPPAAAIFPFEQHSNFSSLELSRRQSHAREQIQEAASVASGCPRRPAAASSCCWSRRSITWASRATWWRSSPATP